MRHYLGLHESVLLVHDYFIANCLCLGLHESVLIVHDYSIVELFRCQSTYRITPGILHGSKCDNLYISIHIRWHPPGTNSATRTNSSMLLLVLVDATLEVATHSLELTAT